MAQDVKEQQAEETTEGRQPWQRLGQEVGNLVGALGQRALGSVAGKVTSATGRLADYADGGVKQAVKKATAPVTGEGAPDEEGGVLHRAGQMVKGVGNLTKGIGQLSKGITGKKGRKAGGGKLKVTNVVETIDIGAPLQVVYNQWTRFEDFPSFLKKVEHVEQESDERLTWKAQIFWSHRSWQSEIIEQVPDERIIWRSKGEKGYVDGAVTFHSLGPNLTRVALVLEYHPQGFFEHTGNLWRAQGRRARLELKHFRRHVMTQALLHPEEIQGWRGTIHEGQVAETGEGSEEATAEKQEEPTEEQRQEASGEQPKEPSGEQREEPGEQREEPGGEQGEGQPKEEGEEQGEREREKAAT